VQPDSIELSVLRDTLFIPQPFTFQADTLSARRFRLSGNWKEETQYKLVLMPGAVLDIYGLTNDSTEIRFSTREEDYYARILLNFSSPNYPMLIQVLDEKGAVVKSGKANSAGIITFEYLSPGRYLFKAIYDENGNGKWDTGNYLKHQQPEKVYISGRAEQLRSNWDYEPTWTITGE
jgi:hypothetical protein